MKTIINTSQQIRRFILTITLFSILAACGGGGGSSTPTPPTITIDDASLSSLVLSAGSLALTKNVTDYTLTTTAETTTVAATVSQAKATLKINDTAINSGITSAPISLEVGDNTITLIVTAADGETKKTYNIKVTRTTLSTDANLSNILLSAGSLSPAFTSDVTDYTLTTTAETTTVTPSVSHATATVSVNNAVSTNTPINLDLGENTITLIVTAEDKSTQTYNIKVTRIDLTADASLQSLTVSSGALSPTFDSKVTAYTLTTSADTISVTPTVSQEKATVTVNTTPTDSTSASAPINLNIGDNTITLIVTAEDKSTQTYNIKVTRIDLTADASLQSLTVSSGALSPTFDSKVTAYTLTTSADTISVTPTVSQEKATVTVNTTATDSASASTPINLNVGENTITLIVTAENKSTQTYNIKVTRIDLTADASLQSLTVSSGALSPTFDSKVTAYTLTTSADTISVTPTVSQEKATVTVNTTATDSASASTPINLNVGENTITLIVTAENASTTQAYFITVTRIEASLTDASLSSILLSADSLNPAFDSDVTDYTLSTNASTTSVTPFASQANATVSVNGTTTKSGDTSAPIELNVGDNTITLIVTATDGETKKTYSITVTRTALPTNASLSSLALSAGSLNPVFASDVTDYTFATNKSTTTVTPVVSDTKSTVTLNNTATNSGNVSAPIDLNLGDNTITLTVTAEDLSTQTYRIKITRIEISTNANLLSLVLSAGSLNPAFTSDVTDYSFTTTAETTTVTPSVSHAMATVKVNDTVTNSGSASVPINLDLGDNNPITVTVTAEDLSTKTYSITITRVPLSTNANLLSLVVSVGNLSPAFASDVTDYSLSTDETSTSVTPSVSHAKATVTVNKIPTNSGSASALIDLNAGDNTITVIVTAEDLSTKTYRIKITRAVLSSNANLSNIVLSAGSLDPTFASDVTAYSFSTIKETTTVTPTLSDTTATVTVNGEKTNSGTASESINLIIGDNPITLIVTAEDGRTKTYKITVTRTDVSVDDASLSSILLSAGSFSPAFASDVTDYTLTATAETTTVTPFTSQSTAKVQVDNSSKTDSGTVSTPITLNAGGETIIKILVTAPDGSTTKTYTITVNRLTSLELLDPNPTAGRKFGEKVVQLNNGNIIVQVSSHAIGDNANVGAVYLYKPTSGTPIKSFYGTKAGDQLGSGGIIALSNSNFLIVSPDEDKNKGEFDAAGSVKLVNGETGDLIKEITGNLANDRLASGGITLLNDNQFVINSPNYKNDGQSAGSGSVQVIGVGGETISTLYGNTYSVTNLGDKGITKLSNNNFVIVSSNYTYNEQANAGIVHIVQLVDSSNASNAVVKSITGQGIKENEYFGGDGIFPLKNGNFLIATQTYNGTEFTNAGAIQLIDGNIDGTNVKILNTLVGDRNDAYLGRADGSTTATTIITTLGNSNYVVLDHAGVGSVRLFSGVDGAQVGGADATVRGDFNGDFQNRLNGYTKITALDNYNYLVSAAYSDITKVDGRTQIDVGSIRLMDGADGAQLSIMYGNTIHEDSFNTSYQEFGSGRVIELSNHKYVVTAPTYHNARGGVGAVILFDNKGVLKATWIGNYSNDFFGEYGLALGNNKFVIASSSEESKDGTLSNVGSVRLADANVVDDQGNIKEIAAIYGDNSSDNLSDGGVTLLNNHNFVFASPFDDVNGEKNLGSVQAVNGDTGTTDKIVGLKQDDMESVQMIRPATTGDYYILSQPLADDHGVDAGKVRLVVPTFPTPTNN